MNANREERDFGLADLADEAWKPAAELGLLLIEPVFWGFGVRRGDGRPVLVLPGLYGGDRYLGPLRDWLRRIGYSPCLSGLERIQDGRSPLINDLGDLADAHFQRSGQRVQSSPQHGRPAGTCGSGSSHASRPPCDRARFTLDDGPRPPTERGAGDRDLQPSDRIVPILRRWSAILGQRTSKCPAATSG